VAWLSLFVLIAAACALGLFWDHVPPRWTTHWGVGGRPDAFAEKDVWSAFWPLIVGFGVWLAFEAMARLIARRAHDERMRSRALSVLRVAGLIPIVILAATSLWLPFGTPSSPLFLIVFSVTVVLAGVVVILRVACAGSRQGTGASGGQRELFYNDPTDSRLWVESPLGAALNFGHPEARRTLGVLLLPPILIVMTIVFCLWAGRHGR
jgi:uncharacterized membrane protein